MKNKLITQFKTIFLYFHFKKWRMIYRKEGKQTKTKHKGLSLTEMVSVVALVGILGAIAIPFYHKYIIYTRASVVESHLLELKKAYQSCLKTSVFDSLNNLPDPTKCDDITELNLQYDSGKLTLTKGTATGKQCFAAKINKGLVSGKKHEGCIEFDSSSGDENNKTFDDGTDNGTCTISTGLCS